MNNYNTGLKFNQLSNVKYNSQIVSAIKQIFTRIGPRPVILNQDKTALAVLENSYEVVLEQEVNGIDEIRFNLPFTDSKAIHLKNENLIQMFETIYIIREVIKKKGSSEPYYEVFAEALWYDLQFSDPLVKTVWLENSAASIFSDLLEGTGWSLGKMEFTNHRTLRLDPESANPLEGISKARSLFNADLVWNTDSLKLDVVKPSTKHSGASIVYRKNMEDIEVFYDTKDLVTRLFVYGKNGLTIKDANNGKLYLEDYSYTNKRRVRSIKDERFTNPFALKEFGLDQLKILSKPRATYRMSAFVLSAITGLSHEEFSIGSIVRVYDKEIDLDDNVRIMRWSYNVIEPSNTKIELEFKLKGLSDLLSDKDLSGSGFDSEDSVTRPEMLELMVFNYLLNSRADDNFSSWENNGWNVDAINGYAGPASFKADGALSTVKSLKQTIYPSHRDAYSISFRGYARSLVKGPNGKVGVNVKITYDDLTSEDQFIPLA